MSERRPHPVALAALAVGMLVGAWALWHDRHFFHDDAYISLRYAWHWLNTGELVWNPGEHVEGYTNFLHLAATTGTAALGADWVSAPRLVNAASALVLLLAFGLGVSRWTTATGTLLGLALIVGSPLLSAWIWGGLEAPMVAALLLAGVMATLRGIEDAPAWAPVGGLLLALAALTRLDAVLVGGVAVASLLWRRPARGMVAGACWLLPVAAHMAWRMTYYGELLPNTFYTKVGDLGGHGISGLSYLAWWTGEPPYWPVLAPFAAWLAWRDEDQQPIVIALVGSVLLHVTYVVWAGGDHMPAFRFFLPMLPLLAWLLALAVSASQRDGQSPVVLGSVVIVCLLLAGARVAPRERDPAAFVGEIVGRWMAENWPEERLVALHTAGSTPFLNPRMRFIDMLGLTDTHIARRMDVPARLPAQQVPGHAKGDGTYVVYREPDVVILGFAEGVKKKDPVFLSDWELARSESFGACYDPRTVQIPYDAAATLGPERDNPLTFTWYERVCDRTRPRAP